MDLPDLNRVVDTYFPITNVNFPEYINQMKRDLLPHVRKLQTEGNIRWFSFLFHPASQLGGREPNDGRLFIHIRLEPSSQLDLNAFINLLPAHFRNPVGVSLSQISGLEVDKFRNNDWAEAWKIHGAASELVLCLLEGHELEPSLQHIVQFLHFITNPLMLGHKCLCIPAGFISF